MAEVFVRITQIWEVPVTAEYGDTEDSLIEKASVPPDTEPDELRTLLPQGYEPVADRNAPPEATPDPSADDPVPALEPAPEV